MLGKLVLVLDMVELGGKLGRLGDPLLKGLSLRERDGSWFWYLGRYSLVLGLGS